MLVIWKRLLGRCETLYNSLVTGLEEDFEYTLQWTVFNGLCYAADETFITSKMTWCILGRDVYSKLHGSYYPHPNLGI